jgi:hypothetical protein
MQATWESCGIQVEIEGERVISWEKATWKTKKERESQIKMRLRDLAGGRKLFTSGWGISGGRLWY